MTDASNALLSTQTADACRLRLGRLTQAAEGDSGLNLDALLVSAEKDIQYLTGFVGHDSLALVDLTESKGGRAIIVSDSRYDEYLQPWREAGFTVVMGVRHRLAETIGRLCRERNLRRIGIQAEHVTLAGRGSLAKAVGDERLVETTGLVGAQRMRKDALEVQAIERAVAIQQDAMAAALNQMAVGMSELEFSAVLEFEMKSRGSFNPSFTPIIGAGSNSSIIHHSTGGTAIRPGVLLVDWGATVDGYCSDMTRTFGVGQMPAKIREIYPIVLDAQQAAIDAIRPGKPCAEIDAVARKVISKAGYAERFAHGLGHGLGMDIHEAPYFNDLQTDVLLEPGMVMTVEPGIYLPGIGGVRIEDDVLVTESGCRVLCDYPKDYPSALIEPAQVNARV